MNSRFLTLGIAAVLAGAICVVLTIQSGLSGATANTPTPGVLDAWPVPDSDIVLIATFPIWREPLSIPIASSTTPSGHSIRAELGPDGTDASFRATFHWTNEYGMAVQTTREVYGLRGQPTAMCLDSSGRLCVAQRAGRFVVIERLVFGAARTRSVPTTSGSIEHILAPPSIRAREVIYEDGDGSDGLIVMLEQARHSADDFFAVRHFPVTAGFIRTATASYDPFATSSTYQQLVGVPVALTVSNSGTSTSYTLEIRRQDGSSPGFGVAPGQFHHIVATDSNGDGLVDLVTVP